MGGEGADPPQSHAPSRRTAARAGTVFDDIGLGSRWLHTHAEANECVIPNETVIARGLEAIHQPFNDPPVAHSKPRPPYAKGTTKEPLIGNSG
jgi:hypothetical protein